MYYFAGEGGRAPPLGADAVQRARRLGDDVLLGESLLAYAGSIDAPGCLPLYAEALACAERSGHLGIQVSLHNNAGCVALEMGNIPGARAHLEAAIRVAEALGSSHLPMSVNLGEVLRAEHDLHGARSTFEEVVRIARRTGDKHNLAMAIAGLACLAADLADWHRAATLHGIAQALTDQTGTPWEPFDEHRRQESLDQARQALGGEQLQQACTRGMTLRFDQAIDLALGGVPPTT
jgi:tetratricopeptide (TPR) repeat protein